MAFGSIQGQNGYVSKYGDTMLGELDMGGQKLTGLPAPINDSDAVNLNYLHTNIFNHFASGYYTGNNQANRIINLGFTPIAVLILNTQGRLSTRGFSGDTTWVLGGYNGLAVTDSPYYKIYSRNETLYTSIQIVENGFEVYYDSIAGVYTNLISQTYNYIAFG